MSRDISPDLQTIRLFLTEPHECSYLPNRLATTSFVDPDITVDEALYSRLSEMGFRRSGHYIYAPRCEGCNACIATRIKAADFIPNRKQRRCANRNSDISVNVTRSINDEEHYALYQTYISQRHQDGDMFPASRQQYDDFIGNLLESSRIIEYRLNNKLIAASVIDLLEDGLSAIYTYFEPTEARRSLGTFAILSQINLARQLKLPYLYLGYWIRDSKKMAYKTDFRPIQLLIKGRWVKLS